ncbi:SAG-related sequence SRS16C [Toxoplasma gondii VAND]|uniref:SAG-related sequence SRS16C n=1 Tax=Toxoplasma gondii VAND TaxID=933077 RepID=A0A086PU86_TOXGO|nr:SAG-related sequence SRS16C [Toxoplasma gondii VAND]
MVMMMGSMQQRRGGLRSNARQLLAVCMSGVLFLSSGQAVADNLLEGLLHRTLQQQLEVTARLTVAGSDAKCDFFTPTTQDSPPVSGSLTLSKGSMTATFECSATQALSISTIPTTIGQNVCDPKKTTNGTMCQFGANDSAGTEVTLKDLLETDRTVNWKKNEQREESKTSQKWSLDLHNEDLPLSDKAFVVGCQATSAARGKELGKTAACKLTVNVEARASSLAENNVVTCAYGKGSNPNPVEVEMSTEKNTLTINCGSDGSLQPTTYAEEYCVADSKDVNRCSTTRFVEIFPKFLKSWWVTETQKRNSATLTIPQTDLPEADQQFLVGCVPKKTAPEDPKKYEESGTETGAPTSCTVLVTVKAASSASHASPTVQILAAASSAAAVTGFIVSSLGVGW